MNNEGRESRSTGRRWWQATAAITVALLLVVGAGPALAQENDDSVEDGEQDAETKALDSTATQWSFQFAYQWMPDYHDDILDNGQTRPAGLDNYVQLRIVAPIPLKKLTILPRLTIRHYENPQGQSGFGGLAPLGLLLQ